MTRPGGSSFARTNLVGKAGERRLAMHYGGHLPKGNHPHDIIIPYPSIPEWLLGARPLEAEAASPLTVEVKTDTHDPDETPNLYLERRTLRPDGSPIEGGLWRAARDGVHAFAYLYKQRGLVVWVWGLPALCAKLDAAAPTSTWRRVRVRNGGGYEAVGRLVPRAELAALAAPHHREDFI